MYLNRDFSIVDLVEKLQDFRKDLRSTEWLKKQTNKTKLAKKKKVLWIAENLSLRIQLSTLVSCSFGNE